MNNASLHVVIADAVQSNGTLLRMWAEPEAAALGISCTVEVRDTLPDIASERGLLFISAEMGAGQNDMSLPERCIGEPGVVFSSVLVCVYGATVKAPMHRAAVRYAAWPLRRKQVRRLLAEAAVVCGPATLVGHAETAPFGNPVPEELAELVPKLIRSVSELYAQCAAACTAAQYTVGSQRAHTLKGAAMSFGQGVLAEVAGALQEAFETGEPDLVRHWVAVAGKLVAA